MTDEITIPAKLLRADLEWDRSERGLEARIKLNALLDAHDRGKPVPHCPLGHVMEIERVFLRDPLVNGYRYRCIDGRCHWTPERDTEALALAAIPKDWLREAEK